jgi:hypothetical protein
VEVLFAQEKNDLKKKIINNFHTENFSAFEQKHVFDAEKAEMNAIIADDQEIKTKYESALKINQKKGGFSEGILLVQTIAIKCVAILANNEKVEEKLKSRNNIAYRSQAMDGIM